ncbi:PQQ-dependent sugar dehydrogenase [Microvirga puerhi]|uniref:PQQ-dependent sugar dehydrogenase n=1 Tax=Microvirga puerhi TaxID=2876078 RepID=A0ABS7VIP8_9HYPH|nr:PQQ-dependent sugar dehydrogenase [Microvirga puerhi]MBZ6074858.1 PQQ-dependent sugar dehydrogenase [Microvirga puerhi]
MRFARSPYHLAAGFALAAFLSAPSIAANGPQGASVEVFAQVPQARSLSVCGGALYVGTKGKAVYGLPISGGRPVQAASGLIAPNGVACLGDRLYVASRDRISAFTPSPDGHLANRVDVYVGLPDIAHHGLRYIRAGPDGRLYVSIGSPCNICRPEGIQGTIVSLTPDGKDLRRVAWGVRNSVGFDWSGGNMYFTDNGADGMGDDIPPDELNELRSGAFYGFPYFGGRVRLKGFENATPPAEQTPPIYEFQAHVATLGIHFYHGSMFPDLQGEALIAEHGSWDRSVPVGYQVVRLRLGSGRSGNGQSFLSGIGRPVDVKELPDGSIVVSDDTGGRIWRVRR